MNPPTDFAQALAEAMAERGLGLERIRYHLARRGYDLSVATLSYWRSGRSRPERPSSIAAVGALEEILEVPRGRLAGLIVPQRGPAESDREQVFPDAGPSVLPVDGRMSDAVRRMGLSGSDGLTRVGVHDIVELDEAGVSVRHAVRELVQAQEDGIESYPVWYEVDGTPTQLGVEPIRRITIGQTVLEASLIVAEVRFETPLRQGQTVVVEYVFHCLRASPMEGWDRTLLSSFRELYMEVRFPQGLVPRSPERYGVGDQDSWSAPTRVRAGRLHHLVTEFGPGRYGLRWSFADPGERGIG